MSEKRGIARKRFSLSVYTCLYPLFSTTNLPDYYLCNRTVDANYYLYIYNEFD